MSSSASITRRLTLAVLLLELVAALVLIATVANHERRVQLTVFKANLRTGASALFGALQEADTKDGSIALDRNQLSVPSEAVYLVTEGSGPALGSQGHFPNVSGDADSFAEARASGVRYLFYILTGERAIDPGKPFAVHHHVRIVYGMPMGRVWHEVIEAIRFFALATLALLGITALLLSWLIRRFLVPIRELAVEAEKVDSNHWTFDAPKSSRKFSELRPLASAIEKSLLRLQRSFEQQRRFTSDAAHELKTDLAIAKSSLQVLSMKQRAIEEYEHGISVSLDDVGRLEATVQKMLTLARLEQSLKNDQQGCDLVEAVFTAVAQSQSYASLRGVGVIPQSSEIQVLVPISREDSFLLCSNVLMNALQYSPAERMVEIDLRRSGGLIALSVRDHGPGISVDDQPFLFDAFYRGDASRSRRTGGTGLGLSICKAICDRAHGTISITNHEEGGALVEIRLPILSSV
jgi:signal transduction histidine kinase